MPKESTKEEEALTLVSGERSSLVMFPEIAPSQKTVNLAGAMQLIEATALSLV